MKKVIFAAVLLLMIGFVFAHGQHNFTEVKQLIDSNVSCTSLANEQLEVIGDYYMEQMHAGEAHEMMDKMMGGEGSESLKQMHINMAKSIYCNENVYEGMMQGMMGSESMMGMMGGGMMNMMGNWGYGSGYWNFFNILCVVLLIGLTILVYLWIIKMLRDMKKKDKKRRQKEK